MRTASLTLSDIERLHSAVLRRSAVDIPQQFQLYKQLCLGMTDLARVKIPLRFVKQELSQRCYQVKKALG
jgi:hypothetical protein